MLKGMLEWFKSKAKMKRWLFLIVISTILVCYEFSKVLTSNELNIWNILEIVLGFTAGFTGIVAGFIYAQKRILEILVEASVSDEKTKNVSVNSLVFNKKIFERGPKIVVIGGGSGLPTILKGLKEYTNNITAILPLCDINNQINTLYDLPEDIKESYISLSKEDETLRKLLEYKPDGRTNFGYTYLKALYNIYGNFEDVFKNANKVLGIKGSVLPITLDNFEMCAELEDGTVQKGEDNIINTVKTKVTKIKRVYVNPTNCIPMKDAIEAIKNADAVILGPGSLYTKVMPNLLIRNVTKALKESMAMKIYVCNIMTKAGETDDFSVSDHIRVLQEHFGKEIVDFCICDSGQITPEIIKKYNLDGADIVDTDLKNVNNQGVVLIEDDLSNIEFGHIRYDSHKLAKIIMQLIYEDFKLDNKKDILEYAILKHKLKIDNKKETRKIKRQNTKGNHKTHGNLTTQEEKIAMHFKASNRSKKKDSKFTKKYKERIESIQGSKKD